MLRCCTVAPRAAAQARGERVAAVAARRSGLGLERRLVVHPRCAADRARRRHAASRIVWATACASATTAAATPIAAANSPLRLVRGSEAGADSARERVVARRRLVVVRVRAASGAFEDVELDCAGALDGWSPLGDRYEYTRLDLVTGGVDQGACRNGRHEIASKAPFGVTVWGWGSGVGKGGTGCTSYALPAAVGLRPINQADVH